jgi:hypothetical protein
VHESLSANFAILKIPVDKKAEDYCNHKFGEPTEGKYKMKSTKLRKIGNNVFQIVEHFCGKERFLLVFECKSSTYELNTELFEDIFNSFFIECK